ncbi:hypothetical protein Ancab_002247 [Ancistrocladus abbreviatus]
MGIKNWSNSRSQSIRLGRSCSRREDVNPRPKWKMIWRIIKKETDKIFGSSTHPTATPLSYDPDAYSRNFDEGCGLSEPEYLSRSFSARFADPSRIDRKNGLMDQCFNLEVA